jgi:hypothetical protein
MASCATQVLDSSGVFFARNPFSRNVNVADARMSPSFNQLARTWQRVASPHHSAPAIMGPPPQVYELQRLVAAKEHTIESMRDQAVALRQGYEQKLAAAESSACRSESEVSSLAGRCSLP